MNNSDQAPNPSDQEAALDKTLRLCKKCFKALPSNSSESCCPECQAGGTSKSAAPNQPGNGAPSPEELAPHFPQLEILELVGQGGMGMVYKARQPKLDRLVALKILPTPIGDTSGFADRFTREAKIMARLSHPNIVAIFDFGKSGDYYYFIMEYVDGVNLRQMEKSQKLTPMEALKIVPILCDALEYAHGEGIVHRDIKPANILIDRKGRVKIADFGLGKLLGKETQKFDLTGSHDVMGTLHYMAPEQYDNPQSVDRRADIFSLGVVFYEMLTGELPLGRFEPPSAKVQIDVRLDEMVLKALERNPERRYQHASELKAKVETLAVKSEPAISATSNKSRSIGVVTVVFLVLLGLAGWWFVSKAHKPTPQEASVASIKSGASGATASSWKIHYIKEKSAKLFPKGYQMIIPTLNENSTMETEDPNDVALAKLVYFNMSTGSEIHYNVESEKPLTKLIYTGVAFYNFYIEVFDENGSQLASAGPYNYGNTVNTLTVVLPNVTHFEVVLKGTRKGWILTKEIRFETAVVGQARVLVTPLASTKGVDSQPSTSSISQSNQPITAFKHNFAAWPDFVAANIGKSRVGGYCFVVRDHGKIAASGMAGYARMPWEKEGPSMPWTSDRTMYVGNQGFTAAAFMKLWEEKKFSLDEPFWPYVKDLFPKVHESVRHITIRDLLAKRSGLVGKHFTLQYARVSLNLPLKPTSGSFTNDNGVIYYDNFDDVFLISLVLERISGESYSEYVKKHLLAPVGATKTDTNAESYLPVLCYESNSPEKQFPGSCLGWQSTDPVGGKSWYTSPIEWSAILAGLADGRIIGANTSRMLFDTGFWGLPATKEDGQVIGYSLGGRRSNSEVEAVHFIDGVDAVLFSNCEEYKIFGLLKKAWELKL